MLISHNIIQIYFEISNLYSQNGMHNESLFYIYEAEEYNELLANSYEIISIINKINIGTVKLYNHLVLSNYELMKEEFIDITAFILDNNKEISIESLEEYENYVSQMLNTTMFPSGRPLLSLNDLLYLEKVNKVLRFSKYNQFGISFLLGREYLKERDTKNSILHLNNAKKMLESANFNEMANFIITEQLYTLITITYLYDGKTKKARMAYDEGIENLNPNSIDVTKLYHFERYIRNGIEFDVMPKKNGLIIKVLKRHTDTCKSDKCTYGILLDNIYKYNEKDNT